MSIDCSKEFIAMCDCEEIQSNWEPQSGDFHISKFGDKYSNLNTENIIIKTNDMVWLPRQDQLQDMMEDYIKGWRNLQNCFYDWLVDCNEGRMYKFGSMEQMWLVYYMLVVNAVIWTGKKWNKANWTDKELENELYNRGV